MYTEGFDEFDGLRDTEKTTRRAYVSNVSQDDADRLARENEQLQKALEKEQFFNKLLDQEIQELKLKNGQTEPHISSYWYGNRGVSKGAFYSLLFVSLAMAAYIGYGIYNNNQSGSGRETVTTGQVTSDESAPTFTTPGGNSQSNVTGEAKPAAEEKINNNTPAPPLTSEEEPAVAQKPVVKDSVPNIIARQQATDRRQAQQEASKPDVAAAAPREIDVEKQVTGGNSGAVDTRPVIARYQVSSKANFYTAPDENTMRNVFISQGEDKVVGALEDKNGFIYVEYTNDLGYTSRGWLSKQDLTKLD